MLFRRQYPVPGFWRAVVSVLALSGCAILQPGDPLQVTVAAIEPQQGAGLELRLLVQLRIQNPNDSPVDYDGVAVNLDVQGKTFATGVSDAQGTVPRFGEAVIAVPVTVSAMRMLRQVMGAMDGQPADRIRYELTGKLHGTGFGSTRFKSSGELSLPAVPGAAGAAATT